MLALGECLPMIGKLLSHTQVLTSAPDARLGRHSVEVAGERILDSIETDMNSSPNTRAAGKVRVTVQ